MLGNNPIRSVLKTDGSILEVKEIFLTLQGEGPLVGTPAVFVRLGGCNLACKFCDTNFENFNTLSVEQILQEILNLSNNKKIKLVVITGGEPFRQPIGLLCDKILQEGLIIQIETNGTLFCKLPKEVLIVCSPKPGRQGYSLIREDLLSNLSAIKFIISNYHLYYNEVPEVGQTKYNIPVFLQPMDELDNNRNKANVELALNLSLNTGCRLSLQMHKILKIR